MRFWMLVAVGAGCAFAQSNPDTPRVVVKDQGFLPFSGPPIQYRSETLDDPIARLQKRLDCEQVSLRYDPDHGYLRSVLELLKVPASSQTLVFSKTSFQYPKISPESPRALYFNDDIYVGQVHGAASLEFVAFDPLRGAIFYILDEHRAEKPRFERAALDCVQCHVSASATRGVPGVMLRSIVTSPTGNQTGGTPAYITGQESPVKERWGGWYVTGVRGGELHMGSALTDRVNVSRYLRPDSDVVAHLVLAHQTQMHNLITATTYQALLGQQYERPAEQLVRYLLFANEAPLDSPVAGVSEFAKEFAARGPRDERGRSLREFDLKTRIFQYPCSYLIYSEAFDAIPEPAKGFLYRRLFEVLSGRDRSPEFDRLSATDRRAVLEILTSTKPGVPAEWRQYLQTHTERNITQ